MSLPRFDGYRSVSIDHPDAAEASTNQIEMSSRPEYRTAPSSETYRGDGTAEGGDTRSMRSARSNAPLNPGSYPPLPSQGIAGLPAYDTEKMGGFTRVPDQGERPKGSSRTSSWDLLSGFKKFEQDYEHFDARNASADHLAYADGDLPKNKAARFYNYLLNVSIVTRWILFIVPVLGILWIPGILYITKFHHGEAWGVSFLRWSVFLTVAWVGWWAALAFSRVVPYILRSTIGIVAVGLRRYIDWLTALSRFVALFIWALVNYVSFLPLIEVKNKSDSVISLMTKLLFGILLCSAVLLAEKLMIQVIATKFHEQSYADRIANQKFAVKVLVTLYRNSNDIPGRSDTLTAAHAHKNANSHDPRRFIRQALKGVKLAATTTTTAFGNVASEIAGQSVLQPNSPAAMVKTALESANKSRLAENTHFYVQDIGSLFSSPEAADAAYALFDKDGNGDMEMTCMELHREQLSIEHSLQDMDSAVGKLDNLFMCLYVVIALLIMAVTLDAQLSTLVTGWGTFVLGLSWLIGGSLQEVLMSIIFLFVKHPFDVGDRVAILTATYTVKEINLLSTVFIDSTGCCVQAPNVVLNTAYIQNMRRSGLQSETFAFDVSYDTTFEQLEALRETMIVFLLKERRDFLPSFDVTVVDLPDQTMLSLTADIKYKSNWQQGALKGKLSPVPSWAQKLTEITGARRNKWICALKSALKEVKVYGPKGDPSAVPAPVRQTMVPWEEVQHKEETAKRAEDKAPEVDTKMPVEGWNLSDKNAVIKDVGDVFGDSDDLNMNNSRRDPPGLRQRPVPLNQPPARLNTQASKATMAQSFQTAEEEIEMAPRGDPIA
ncbi:hypothetical protein HWV62_34337 [Athelia sp. TMB]|nr:hypothetical protein HWV62_34337 [Athelia sp. TMB]